MRKSRQALLKISEIMLPEWAAPILIFVVCLFSFGIILSRLGFFQDDWHHVFYAYWQGAQGLQRFLLADRGPFAWIVYVLFFNILGYSPAAWHWSLMFLRFVTALMFWLAVRQIWPGQNRMAAWLGLLFAVYPIFTLQPLAVAYTLHWVMYLVFMISLFLMLRAVRNAKTYLPLTLVAVLLEAVHLAFIEYFSGLEVCRLVFLWLLFRETPSKDRLKRTIKYGLPYLVILALYVVYRSSYSVLFGYDRFTVLATLTDLVRSPLVGLTGILQSMFQDIVYVIVSQWYSAIDPALIDLSRPSTYLIFGSMVGFALIAYFVFGRLGAPDSESDHAGPARQVAVGGFVCILLALFPFWLAGFSIYQKNLLWSERLALAAMPGASMLVTGIVYAMTARNIQRHLALSVLLGLAIGLQVETARNFQASWDKQLQFYWQLHWRAPALQPNTMIVSDQEILFYMGIYPTAFSINLLYPQATTPPAASYWFDAGFEHVNFDNFSAGKPITFEKYATTFTARADDVVAITFEPGLDQCLWILGPRYAHVRDLTPEASTWLTVSNASRILAGPETIPPPQIFGKEPQRTWCYYYEKADLASQYQEWGKIVQLWQEASQQGMRARNGVELTPFISAYARINDWQTAQELALQAQALPDRSSDVMCDLWRSLDAATQPSAERDRTVALVETKLGCQN
jgi:hypothetical protein